MKKTIATLLILGSFSALANVQVGTYKLGSCDIRVTPQNNSGLVELLVDNGSGYGRIILDTAAHELVSINSCNSKFSPERYPITTTASREMGKVKYISRCGGKFHAYDSTANVEIDEGTGRISKFELKVKVARLGFPNGINSGPLKETMEDFNCAN